MDSIGGIDTSRIQSMMQKLQAMAAQTRASETSDTQSVDQSATTTATGSATSVDFSSVLKASLDKVNETQHSAEALGERFTKGDDSVSLSEVMIAGQKASIALQATVQVRTKLVTAYNDIMNMQV